jgi:DNA repair exonuclease SbcCD nuclease subunit
MLVYHISDIHIRHGDKERSRYDEYAFVFGEFCKVVHANPSKKCVVITGDIFHDKTRIDSPGIHLFYKLLQELDGIEVYVIRGNHDYKQWKKDDMDMISSLLTNRRGMEHVHYFNKSGIFNVSDELSFGVLAIQDVLLAGNTTATEKNVGVTFPRPCKGTSKHNIALFHGEPMYPKMFSGYDFAMLGDIHERRVWKEGDRTCGFAGSMIRQNRGESKESHGYLLWDLATKSVTEHDIVNPWVRDTVATKSLPEEDNVDGTEFTMSSDDWCKYIENDGDDININNNAILTNIIKHPDVYLRVKDVDGYPSIQQKVLDRNQKIQKKIDTYKDLQGSFSSKKELRLLSLKWHWILCYGPNNTFDFTKLDSKVNSIGGENASGKTSFIETIIISLYGTGFPSRTCKQYSASIINAHKPVGEKSNTSVIFSLNNKMYKVYRSFASQESVNGTTLHAIARATGVEMFKEDEGWSNVCSGKTATDDWVCINVASLQSIMMTNIVSQHSDYDFFTMSAPDQKAVLDDAMCIGMLSAFRDCLKEARLAHIYIKDMLHSVRDRMIKTCDVEELECLRKELAQLSKHQSKLPKWMPVSLDDKQHYIDIVNAFNPQFNDIVKDLPQYDQRVEPVYGVTSNNIKTIVEDYRTICEGFVLTKQVADKFDQNQYDDLTAKFENIKQPVFDGGPFNLKCKCCKERQSSVVDLDDFMTWSKLKNYRKLSLSNTLRRYVRDQVDIDQWNDAVSIVENYDAISDQFKIERLKHKIASMSDKDLDTDFLELISEYEERENNMVKCLSKMEAYSRDVYTEKILPMFTRRINDIIGCLTDKLNICHDINSKGQFDWFIKLDTTDHKNIQTNIQKASGFQRFAMSLASRIALSQIGSFSFRQLFIDEGFSACDEKHLMEVPEFLQKLIGIFSSVTIVTHLQELKDIIPSVVTIGGVHSFGDIVHSQIRL